MDYCDPCRRHLNGALACPGCGTSAESPRWREPDQGGYRAAPSGAEGEAPQRPEGPEGPDGEYGESGGYDERVDDADGEPSGRAARRRGRGRGPVADGPGGASRRDRKAAAHRRRRRRTLFVAAGFVLAAGGLSLAELGMDAPVRRRSRPRPEASRRTGTPWWRRGSRAGRPPGLRARQDRPPRAHLTPRRPPRPPRRRSRSPRGATNRRRTPSRRREAPPAPRHPPPQRPRRPRTRPRHRTRPPGPHNRNRPRRSRASGSSGGAHRGPLRSPQGPFWEAPGTSRSQLPRPGPLRVGDQNLTWRS